MFATLIITVLAGERTNWLIQRAHDATRQAELKKVIFVLSDHRGRLYLETGDGRRKTMLSLFGRNPSWTPDGKIIYASLDMPQQIWIADGDGGHAHQIGDISIGPLDPIMKPQMGGDMIVFSDQFGIWAMAADGTGLQRVVEDAGSPSLAPKTGRWLTYTVPGDDDEIWRANIDGTGARQLTFRGVSPRRPDGNASAVSPDESTVAYFCGKQSTRRGEPIFHWGQRQVCTIPASGGTPTVITHCTPVHNETELLALSAGGCITSDGPAWLTDRTLIFTRGAPNQDDRGTFWVRRVDGSFSDLNGSLQRLAPTRGGGATPAKIARFAGAPGTAQCYSQSVSALLRRFVGFNAAAAAFGLSGAADLQNAILAYCEG